MCLHCQRLTGDDVAAFERPPLRTISRPTRGISSMHSSVPKGRIVRSVSVQRCVRVLAGRADGQHRARGTAHDLVRRRAEEREIDDVTAVDTHDDQISVAFGRREDFTMSLAMPDERFRRAAVAKVVGDERLQLVPCRRFGRLPVFHELARFVPRELLERRSRWLVPRPLDDVEERHAGPRLLRQRPGPLERRQRRVREINRAENSPERQRSGGVHARRYSQYGTSSSPEHFLGDRAEHEMLKSARAVCAHHEHAGPDARGARENLRNGIADLHDDLAIHLRVESRDSCRVSGRSYAHHLRTPRVWGRKDAVWVDRYRRPRHVHVENSQLGVIPTGDGRSLFERVPRRVREVYRTQNLSESHGSEISDWQLSLRNTVARGSPTSGRRRAVRPGTSTHARIRTLGPMPVVAVLYHQDAVAQPRNDIPTAIRGECHTNIDNALRLRYRLVQSFRRHT